jgi:hypothetical protein
VKHILILCGLLLIAMPVFCKDVPEVGMTPQNVMVWNRTDYDVVLKINADLARWCKAKVGSVCPINTISTFLNLDRSLLIYVVDFKYIDDAGAVYLVNITDQKSIEGKVWMSDWNPLILEEIPFKSVSN